MSSPLHFHDHPEYEQLLGMVDRDAPEASREVRRHVEDCWKCRSRIEEMQAAITEFARYHERQVLPRIPGAPRPWLDLRIAMRQWDQENPQQSVWKKLGWARIGVTGTMACAALAYVAMVTTDRHPAAPATRPSIAAVPAKQETARVELAKAASPRTIGAPAAIKMPVPAEPLANAEVRVLAILHRVGADLGDPVDAAIGTDGKIHVDGVGLGEERQIEIRAALAAEPGVAIRFEGAAANTATPPRPMSLEAARNPFESQLTRLAGGAAALERLANRVLDESDAVLVRGHALHNLIRRFPPERRAELHESARATLDEMIAVHRQGYEQHATTLLTLLTPVRQGLNAPAARVAPAGDRLDAAQRLDRVLSVIFGVSRTFLSAEQLVAELSTACDELSAAAGARE